MPFLLINRHFMFDEMDVSHRGKMTEFANRFDFFSKLRECICHDLEGKMDHDLSQACHDAQSYSDTLKTQSRQMGIPIDIISTYLRFAEKKILSKELTESSAQLKEDKQAYLNDFSLFFRSIIFFCSWLYNCIHPKNLTQHQPLAEKESPLNFTLLINGAYYYSTAELEPETYLITIKIQELNKEKPFILPLQHISGKWDTVVSSLIQDFEPWPASLLAHFETHINWQSTLSSFKLKRDEPAACHKEKNNTGTPLVAKSERHSVC
jgi:hypothetical protein